MFYSNLNYIHVLSSIKHASDAVLETVLIYKSGNSKDLIRTFDSKQML